MIQKTNLLYHSRDYGCNMKVGDFVKHVFAHPKQKMVGVIIEKVFDPLATSNDVYNVVWMDGTVGKNVWDYDLVLYNEKA